MTTWLSCGHKAIYDDDYEIINANFCSWEMLEIGEDGYIPAIAYGMLCKNCQIDYEAVVQE